MFQDGKRVFQDGSFDFLMLVTIFIGEVAMFFNERCRRGGHLAH